MSKQLLKVLGRILLLVGCLAPILTGCDTIRVTVPEQESFECLDFDDRMTGEPQATDVKYIREFVEEYGPVMPGQIILTGPASHIEELEPTRTLGIETIGPTLYLEERTSQNARIAVLYNTAGRNTVDVIHEIYQTIIERNADGKAIHVLASPNRLVGAPWGIDADPWGIDADPWGIDADPWGIDADPATGDPNLIRIPGESTEAPWRQWAFVGEAGIDLYDIHTKRPRRTVNTYGEGVDVFIFDTSPFTSTDISTRDVMNRQLCVYHPDLVINIDAMTDSKIHEHGYFVAGLVRFVAPNSHLHLIRVLNEDGVGDIYSFLVALQQLKESRGNMQNAVLNLSMSLHDFEDEEQAEAFGPSEEQIEALLNLLPEIYHPYITDPQPILALELMMNEMAASGAVVIAATGNGSDLSNDKDELAGMPAAFITTVGTAGNNAEGERACFSNKTEKQTVCATEAEDEASCLGEEGLLAPSGDGVGRPEKCRYPFPSAEAALVCRENPNTYDCPYALISITTEGFAYWLGTSFGTPLASGTAALMLGTEAENANASRVRQWFQDWCGVLSVPAALELAPPNCSTDR